MTGIGLYGDTNRLSLSYDYGTSNNVGRIRSRTDALQSNQSVSYTYDALYRLKDAVNSNWSIHWDYDAYGNRTSQTPSGGINIGSQTMNGWVNNKHSTFGYDNAGNVTSDGQHNYTFDAEGRITAIDGGTVQFAYDSEGRRIKKVNPTGSVTYYFYGLTGLMSEFTTESTGASIAATTNQLQYRVAEQTGTAVIITDANGATVETNRVFPFGEPWQTNGNSTNDQKFTTYDRESVSNLDYAMARFYASRNGRFAAPDPILGDPRNPQSWNRYSYAVNDPVNFGDPSGGYVEKVGECYFNVTVFYVNGQKDSEEREFILCEVPVIRTASAEQSTAQQAGAQSSKKASASCVSPLQSKDLLMVYAETKLLAWLTGKTVGIGVGASAGLGVGGSKWGLGLQGSGSVLIVTDLRGNSGIMYSLAVGTGPMGAIVNSGGLVGGANAGIQYLVSGKTLNQMKGSSYSSSVAVGPVGADVGRNTLAMTIGEGFGARASGAVQPGASGVVPVCKLGS